MNDFWFVRLPASGLECTILFCGNLEDVQVYVQNIFQINGRYEKVAPDAANLFIQNGFRCYLAPNYSEQVIADE